MALGPRVKVIILNILPELKPDGLKIFPEDRFNVSRYNCKVTTP